MKYSYIIILFCINLTLVGQSSLYFNPEIQSVTFSDVLFTPSQIILKENSTLSTKNSTNVISDLYDIDKTELKFKNETRINERIIIEKYNRYVDGIKVAHSNYIVLKEDNRIKSLYAEHYDIRTIQNTKSLSEREALTKALPLLKSDLFSWDANINLLSLYNINSDMHKKLKEVLEFDYPKSELIYVKDFYTEAQNLELAYLFTIESVIPEFRDRVYISAKDGRILLRDPQLKHGSGDTRYSGNKSFPTTEINGPPGAIYELKGTEPVSGIYCETRSLEGLGGLPISSPAIIALSDSIADGDAPDPCIADSLETIAEFGDDIWNKNEHKKVPFSDSIPACCPVYVSMQCDEVRNDDIALDAHWGASMVAKYFKEIHNRFGYDDAGADLYSYVHHGLSYENATWNGMIMKYGDGAYQDGTNPGGMFSPLVSLDICAHEIGHAICTSTSDLVYVGESGALNEGLSDIWSACIEGYAIDSVDSSLNYLRWAIGEQADQRDSGLYDEPGARALRWMDHPPAESNPDTYGAGIWWQDPNCASPNVANDFCGVHFNSGVLNKWFYLLTEGSGLPLSPGLNKPAFDDEMNDKNHTYSVDGIGMHKSEKIIYGANLLLLPNSNFADMRAASIDIARSLFGPCSNEVEQTISAWYAVGVGPDFGTCLPTIEFNQFNLKQVTETSLLDGCGASKDITLSIYSYMANETITFTTAGNAINGDDYELCFTSLDFNGDEEKELKITIFDDKLEEGNDTIIINFTGGSYADSDTVIILNDDGTPAIGSIEVLFSEQFDTDDGSWQQELVNPNSMINQWYIDTTINYQAHISYPPSTNVPSYTQVVESHIRIKSPLIDGLGRKNVSVSFNYQVGGERDLVDPSAIFDYGTFEVSYDGFSWEEIELFVGDTLSGGTVPDSGLYNIVLPQLDNTTFYLGYTWYNDALSGSPYSFMIDSIVVKGEGLEIESSIGATMETVVPESANISFISILDNEVIATIEDTKGNLGCTYLTIIDNDLINDTTPSICKLRSKKVFDFQSENTVDSVLLTLYFKESEIDEWNNFTTLNILSVQDSDIDNFQASYTIIDNSQINIGNNTNSGNGYVTYTFWIPSTARTLALTDRPSTPQVMIVTNNTDNDLESLRDIIAKACPQDTITFDPVTNGNLIMLTSGTILIDKDLHIIGNGTNNTQVYNSFGTTININSGAEISIKDIRFRSDNPFPAIKNNGQIIIRDSLSIGQ